MAPAPGSRPETNVPDTPPAPTADAGADERRLVAAVLRKDRKATAELVSIHADAVYSYVRHRMAPRVESVDDVVHDVFVAALSNLSAFRGASALRSWLLGIARHKIEDYYRDLLRRPEAFDDTVETKEPPDDQPPIEERIDRARAAEKTQRILSMLPESYSVALLWRYWENRSIREMADATGRTEKAIERLLARAKTRFRELWGEV
jgi:RNA polymerase sigma factor (sigma-70 family)